MVCPLMKWVTTVGKFLVVLVGGEVLLGILGLLAGAAFGFSVAAYGVVFGTIGVLCVATHFGVKLSHELDAGDALHRHFLYYAVGAVTGMLLLDALVLTFMPPTRPILIDAVVVTASLLLPYLLWRREIRPQPHP